MRLAHAVRVVVSVLMCPAAAVAQATAGDAGAIHAPLDGNSFVVRDVRVFDGQRVVERTNVVVRAGRIAAIGDDSPPADLPVVNGSGRTLVPGHVDAQAQVQIAEGGDMTPGAPADLVLVDGNPLADPRAPRVVVRAFTNGYDVRGSPGRTAQPPARRSSRKRFPCG